MVLGVICCAMLSCIARHMHALEALLIGSKAQRVLHGTWSGCDLQKLGTSAMLHAMMHEW